MLTQFEKIPLKKKPTNRWVKQRHKLRKTQKQGKHKSQMYYMKAAFGRRRDW